ncbi:hypothetical protein OESDEN_10366 [Oesophagostomum dentatum]|uniref:Uncharacterized protein n=1 Tax=Oesophagostomum dentatum TaxID=61180 RepID=A0A0B1T323_OESDE|nr:hypothetical protein OESDEN_10366 [Oesophagostomum dentatum]
MPSYSERAKDKANRMSNECVQEVRSNPEASLLPTINYWLKVVDRIKSMTWGDMEKRLQVLTLYARTGYLSRRAAYGRAVRSTLGDAGMEHVRDLLRNLPDGSTFLQLQHPNMHIYISHDLVKISSLCNYA